MQVNVMLTVEQKRSLATLCGNNKAVHGMVTSVVSKQRQSLAWHARSLESLSAGRSQLPYLMPLLPICIDSAQGAHITDIDGNHYIDCHMGYTAMLLGHNPPEVLESFKASLDKQPGAGYFIKAQVELGEILCEMVPTLERVAFLHSGADAVMAAIRLARAATGKKLIAKFEGSYHGWLEPGLYNTAASWSARISDDPLDTLRPQAATGGVSLGFGQDLLILPFNEEVSLRLIEEKAGELGGVVLEPSPRYMGNHLAECQNFSQKVRELTQKHHIPLIFDEVVTGFRLAQGGAAEAFNITPDLACYAKITSGLGLPLGIVGGKAALMEQASSEGLISDFLNNKVWISTTNAASSLVTLAALTQFRYLKNHYQALMGRIDRNHQLLNYALKRVNKETGINISLDGHPRLYNTLVFESFNEPPHNLRRPSANYQPQQVRLMRLLTLYLRLQHIYAESTPSMHLSSAHSDEDIARIAAGIQHALNQMRSHGLL
ncbi:MAG: aminotransferase class III-fold pyridoxal phosphate-dependent enzyme [Deinococcales bacterium]